MVTDQEPAAPRRADPDVAVRHDRRRPGRVEVDPALIPLLRGTAPLVEPIALPPVTPGYTGQGCFDFDAGGAVAPQERVARLDDRGNPGRGLVLGSLLSLPFWAMTAAICTWLFG